MWLALPAIVISSSPSQMPELFLPVLVLVHGGARSNGVVRERHVRRAEELPAPSWTWLQHR